MTSPHDKKDAAIDALLDQLALQYVQQEPPADAVERIKARLKQDQRGRLLSDNELDWLAAAGDGMPTPGGTEDE